MVEPMKNMTWGKGREASKPFMKSLMTCLMAYNEPFRSVTRFLYASLSALATLGFMLTHYPVNRYWNSSVIRTNLFHEIFNENVNFIGYIIVGISEGNSFWRTSWVSRLVCEVVTDCFWRCCFIESQLIL